MAANYVNLTDTLEEWRVKANEVYGKVGNLSTLTKNATVSYTGIVGKNADDFTGTHATFTIRRVAGSYEVDIELGGSGYEIGDTVLVDGSLLGGSSGTNDATITITDVDPGFAAIDASVAGTAVGDLISEVNALRAELGSLLDFSLETNAQTFYEAINELENIVRADNPGPDNYLLQTDANSLVAAINELETALRGSNADYALDTDADDLVSAINEFQSEIGRVEDFDAQGTSPQADATHSITYVNLGDTVVSAINALKNKLDIVADELGGIMSSDYDGPDNNIMDALDSLYNRSDLGTLDQVYVRRNGTEEMTGILQVSQYGVTSNANNLLIKTGTSDVTAMTINASNQNVGIGGAPGTHKVKITGAVNATTGLYWDGDSTDTRYIRADVGSAQNLDIDTTVRASIALSPNAGKTITIGGSVVTNDTYNFKEWTQDQIGEMFTNNDETGGISAVYNDTTGKITLNIANGTASNGIHTHVHDNITDWDEAVQDTVGGMVTSNTETGITVTYDDATGKLNFDVDKYAQVQVTDTDSGYTWASSGTATGGEYNDVLKFVDGGGIDLDIDTTNDAIRIQHTDTSSQASVDNSNGNVIQDISLDTYGHITSIGSVDLDLRYSRNSFKTWTVDSTDTEYTWSNTGSVVADDRDDTIKLVESDSIDIDVDATNDAVQWNVKAEYIQDTVGAMMGGNTESGISVEYDDTNGKINFNVNDPTITFAGGDVSGSFTMTNLGSVNNIELTVANDSHTHDGRYYTETEADNRFVRKSTDNALSQSLSDVAWLINADGATNNNNDHVWYDDNTTDGYVGSFHFVADDAYKSSGNARVVAGRFDGSFKGNLTGNVTGNVTGNADTSSSCSGNAATATQVYVTETDSATNYAICGVVKGDNENGNESVYADNAIYFNASTNTIVATNFDGTATKAKYADLAENYLADAVYEVGTVIAIGGEAEVTAADITNQHSVLGVVSDKPAYLMNSDLEGGTTVALKGRVPVRVIGKVKKGDRLAPSMESGLATVKNEKDAWSFAIALHDTEGTPDQPGIVEAVIL